MIVYLSISITLVNKNAVRSCSLSLYLRVCICVFNLYICIVNAPGLPERGCDKGPLLLLLLLLLLLYMVFLVYVCALMRWWLAIYLSGGA